VSGRSSLTYAGWHRRSDRVGAALLARRRRRGERWGLAFGIGDWADHAVAYLGAQKAGVVPVLLPVEPPLQVPTDLARRCSVRGVISTTRAEASGDPGWVTLAELETCPAEPLPRAEPDDVADVIFTSGTTGRPRPVAATHANILATTHGVPPLWSGRTLVHSLAPWTAIGTQGALLIQLRQALTTVVVAPFEPARFREAVHDHGATLVYVIPAMANVLVEAAREPKRVLTTVELVLLAGSPPSAATLEGLTQTFPNASVVSLYGLTEAGGAQLLMRYDRSRPRALGRPTRGTEVRVVDDRGDSAQPGTTGEIWLRPRGVPPRRYVGGRSGTGFAGGWIRTGDLGHVDADGYVIFDGRKKDVIICAAQKISPAEVETALKEHPGVSDAAVVGIPHPILGEEVAALIVTRGGVDHAGVRRFLRSRLASHKIPTRIVSAPSLPRGPAGKVDSAQVARRITGA
jgi:acyl-CoA synthetase (AMP-forming)/AMP-acid ligase II